MRDDVREAVLDCVNYAVTKKTQSGRHIAPLAMKIAKKTVSIVQQNIIFSIGVKFCVMLLGAMNLATMWMAVFADVGVAVIATLKAMRCLRIKK